MEKKIMILFALCVLFLSPLVLSESIAGYKVPDSVPLNQGITATGLYVPDGNVYANKLCSFYFLDTSGNLVVRSDDQFTDATGRFAMPPFVVTEPLFQRDGNYLIHTVCGTATATHSFLIGQKQEVFDFFGIKYYPASFGYDLVYFMNMDYTFAMLMLIFVMAIIIALAIRFKSHLF